MQEKKQKKIKASGTPANLAGYPMGAGHFGNLRLFSMYPAKLPCPRLRAFSCLDARKEAKENQGVRDASQIWRGTRWGAGQIGALRLFSMYLAKLPRPRQRAFSCLDTRKEAKEDQGVRDASQIWRGTRWGPAILGTFGDSRCTQPNFPALGRGPLITDR